MRGTDCTTAEVIHQNSKSDVTQELNILYTEPRQHIWIHACSMLVLIFPSLCWAFLSQTTVNLKVVCLISPSLNSCLRYCLVTSTWNTWYSQMEAAILVRLCLPEPPIPTSSMLPLNWVITRTRRVTVKGTQIYYPHHRSHLKSFIFQNSCHCHLNGFYYWQGFLTNIQLFVSIPLNF